MLKHVSGSECQVSNFLYLPSSVRTPHYTNRHAPRHPTHHDIFLNESRLRSAFIFRTYRFSFAAAPGGGLMSVCRTFRSPGPPV